MARIIWSPQALADVDAICEFIARDAPRFASIFGQRIFQSVKRLEQFPLAGRIVPEVGEDNLREISLKSYRIIYRVYEKGERVEIVTVYHRARLLDPGDLSSVGP